MLPDEPTDEERAEELPEDNGTLFRPAEDTANSPNDAPTTRQKPALDDTHPVTDTDLAAEEAYDSDISKAAEASDPDIPPPPKAYPLEPKETKD